MTTLGIDAPWVDEIAVPGHDRPAYLVRPAASSAAGHPAVLWLHWLGTFHADRREFLPEAVELATRGVVSLLPEGHFPWRQDPDGTSLDHAMVRAELRRVRAAMAALVGTTGVDPDRIGVVGHDYGAMYALAADGLDARAVVAVTPDVGWHHWFERYWLGGPSEDEAYRHGFGEADPLAGAARCQDRLLLQWAELDEYVPLEVPATYAVVAPRARTVTYAGRDHRLAEPAAVRDRRSFLLARLASPDLEGAG